MITATMPTTGPFYRFYALAAYLPRLLYVNLLWIGFTVLGLGVVGAFPATAAAFALVRDDLRGDGAVTWRRFAARFKSELRRANLAGWPVAASVFAVAFYARLLGDQDAASWVLASAAALVGFAAVLLVIALYLFPVLAHYTVTGWRIWLFALYIGMRRPVHSVLMAVAAASMLVGFVFVVPAMLPVFGVSLPVYVLMLIAGSGFRSLEAAE